MALVPAALWLGFFLGLDRREPEPKRLVVRTLLAGAVVYAALAAPLLQGLFAVDEWLYATTWSRLLGGILVVGVVEMLIVYVAVRYTIFERPDFDERVDGVIYCVAAGLGVATVINFAYVVGRGGVDLDVGSVRIVINTLAYGAIAGVLGYFVGQARFERVPIWYLPAGLSLAALLSGLLLFVLEGRGDGLVPTGRWLDLALAAGVAVLALAAVFGLVARAEAEPLPVARAPVPRAPGPRAPAPRERRRPIAPRTYAPAPIAAREGEAEVVDEVDGDPPDVSTQDESAPDTPSDDPTGREAAG
jgi:RsiW-degrading membrane proteinase PrsW (M82 family)